MLDWDLDPTNFLASQFQVQAPAEETACVICARPSSDQPHTVFFVDVNPTSRSYSEIVGEIPLGKAAPPPRAISRENGSVDGMPRSSDTHEPAPDHPIAPRVLLPHDPTCRFGFISAGLSLHNRSSAISAWRQRANPPVPISWELHEIISVADVVHSAGNLPPLLRPSGAVPALITDIALSPDDGFLYAACWGTGDLKQFDVSNPLRPREVGSVSVGGIAARAAHPSQARRLSGGPATVSVSRDGRRVYLTNALSRSWEQQLYPDGFEGWMVKLDTESSGGIAFDPNFFVDFGELRPLRVYLPDRGLGRG